MDKLAKPTVAVQLDCMCIICPNCGVHELQNCNEEITLNSYWNIKAFKVDNWSYCLECDCWFDDKGNIETN